MLRQVTAFGAVAVPALCPASILPGRGRGHARVSRQTFSNPSCKQPELLPETWTLQTTLREFHCCSGGSTATSLERSNTLEMQHKCHWMRLPRPVMAVSRTQIPRWMGFMSPRAYVSLHMTYRAFATTPPYLEESRQGRRPRRRRHASSTTSAHRRREKGWLRETTNDEPSTSRAYTGLHDDRVPPYQSSSDAFLRRGASSGEEEGAVTAQPPPTSSSVPPSSTSAMGWSYDVVDPQSGKTSLDVLYERHFNHIHRILEQPLPPLPRDGNMNPDFFMGFAVYRYTLRDQYRAVVAKALGIQVAAVRLSVAWSGRFDVRHFSKAQKVCGIWLDRRRLADTTTESATMDDDALPPLLQEKITGLINAVNACNRPDLLGVQLIQASMALPEVEFAISRREHRLLFHLHQWIRATLLQRHLVVVVLGCPPPRQHESATAATTSGARGKQGGAGVVTAARLNGDAQVEAATTLSHVLQQWMDSETREVAAQRQLIESRWLKQLHNREVVPEVILLTDVATRLAHAIAAGEMALLHGRGGEAASSPDATGGDGTGDGGSRDEDTGYQVAPERMPLGSREEPLLDSVTHELLCRVGAEHRPSAGDRAERRNALGDAVFLSSLPQTLQNAAVKWVRVVYQALFFRDAHFDGELSTSSDSAVALRVRASLPAFFAHGVYAGGKDEMLYLQHNKAAMDALLLHPHDVSLRKKFMSRMRSGHRRMRMQEESAAAHPN